MAKMRKVTSFCMVFFIMLLCMVSGISVASAETTSAVSINVTETVDGNYYTLTGTTPATDGQRLQWTNDYNTCINTNARLEYSVKAPAAGYYALSFDYLSLFAANDANNGHRNIYIRVMVGDEKIVNIQKLPLTAIAASTSSTAMNNAERYTCPTLIPLTAGENIVKIGVFGGSDAEKAGEQNNACQMAVRTTNSFQLALQRPIMTINASDFSKRSGFSATISGEEPQDGDKLSYGNEAIFFAVNAEKEGYYDVSADISTGNAVTHITVATKEPAGVTTNMMTAKVQDNTAFNTGHDKDLPSHSLGTGLYLEKGENTVVLTSDNWTRLENISFSYSEQQAPNTNKELSLVPLAFAKTLESSSGTATSGDGRYRFGFAKIYPSVNEGMGVVLNLVPGTYKVSMRSRDQVGGTAALNLDGKRVVSGVSVPATTKYQDVVLSENVSIGQVGEHTLKVINETSTGAVFCGILVEKVGEYVGPSVDDEIPTIEDGTYTETLETPVTLQSGNPYSMTIYSERALSYELSLNFVDAPNGKVDVYANDVKQFGDIEVTEAGLIALGDVALQRGNNVIKIEAASGTAAFNALTFNVVDSFEGGEMQIDVTEGSAIPAKKITNYISGSAVFMVDDYVEFDYYSEEERIVLIAFDYAAKRSTSLYSIAVNGKTQIEDAGLDYTGSMSEFVYKETLMPNTLMIPAGEGTVRFSLSYDQIYMKNITLSAPENELIITDLSVVNEAGGRLPYTLEDGVKARGAVTLWRFGQPEQNEMRLIVAQYQNDTLIGVKEQTVDPMQVENGKKITVYTEPMYLKADGMLKAFLWDKASFAPIQTEVIHEEIPEIFMEEDIETLKNQPVSYQLSEDVKKNETDYYGDYSDGIVKSIFYDGYNNTKVFAYMGIPETTTGEKVPAVVCVHGGRGKAYIDWVKRWNKEGVAAIAMDMYGGGPETYVEGTGENAGNGMQKHPYAGIKPYEDFSGLNNGKSAGMYQTVANVMYAYNLLASMDEIDATKIGITGISWGGVTTTTVIGVDDRFCFAVPVYGCGYLDECRTYFSTNYFQKENATLAWDPANFAVKSEIPVMYINSDADGHFSLNSTTNTAAITKSGFMSIRNGLTHGQSQSYSIDQIYTFAKDIFENGKDNFMRIRTAKITGNTFTVTCDLPVGVAAESATVYYIKDAKLPWTGAHSGITAQGISWKTVNGVVSGDSITATLPDDTTFAYMSVADNAGNIISTGLLERQAQ